MMGTLQFALNLQLYQNKKMKKTGQTKFRRGKKSKNLITICISQTHKELLERNNKDKHGKKGQKS